MTPIYNASTLRKVSSDAIIAEYTRIKRDFVPTVLYKVNEANFAAANAGCQSATNDFNLLCMGLSTKESQNYLKKGLQSELIGLGFKTIIEIYNDMMKVTCTW